MKKAVLVLSIIGMIYSPFFYLFYFDYYLTYMAKNYNLTQQFYFNYWLMCSIIVGVAFIAAVVVGILTIVSLFKGGQRKKQIALGVLTLLFVQPIAGILLLALPAKNYEEPGLTCVMTPNNQQEEPQNYVYEAPKEEPKEETVRNNGKYDIKLSDYKGNQYREDEEN